MANIVLGLQGGVANGSESTFDSQPMQAGVHLRWSFLAALGFPPGGFWLCRRAASPKDRTIPPPPSISQSSTVVAPGNTTAVTGVTQGTQWQANLPTPCQSVTLAGCAAPGCQEVVIETFSLDANGDLQVSGRRVVPVDQGSFRISVQAREISCVRVVGAGSVDECGCGTVQPPKDCGCGSDNGGNPPCGTQPGWGTTNSNGWQCWGVPFTLPVTVANWPARYFGAPDPATTPASFVEQKDVDEAIRRLGNLRLAAGMTPAQQRAELQKLRAELVRLVQGFPSTLQASVPIPDSPAQANAPQLNLSLIQELLLLALDPYFARVLGLYFVDEQAAPGVQYDYSITGFWGSVPASATVIFPGMAPATSLASGSATLNSVTIQEQDSTTFWRWLAQPGLDPSAPSVAQTAVTASLSGIPEAQQPSALLVAVSRAYDFFAESAQLSFALSQPAARVDIQMSGSGTIQALSNNAIVSTASFSSAQLSTVTVTNANSPIDQIQIVGTSATLVIGALTLYPLTTSTIGTLYAIIPPPIAIQPVPAPGPAFATFRHRQADIDTTTLTLVPHSLIDVVWPEQPASLAQQVGDPVSDPLQLPAPTRPIGFVAERQDSGVPNSAQRIPGWIATRSTPAPQQGSPVTTSNLYRLVDSQLPDPVGGWSYQVAAFDLFGALGAWSAWTSPMQVEKIAAAPTTMRVKKFDNSAAAGGNAEPDGSGWVGGTLSLIVNWSGAAFMMYPDIVTARITVEAIDESGNVTSQLTTSDLTVPAPSIQALTVSSIVATPSTDGYTYTVDIQTNPPLAALCTFDPSQVLMLTLADGTTERYVVRPSNPLAPKAGPIVARLIAGSSARIVSTTSDFLGQPAYLVSGYGTQPQFSVPLEVPITQTTARAQVSVTGSTKNPFLANEQIIDPNTGKSRCEPQSVKPKFSAPQRLVPQTPTTPTPEVNHVYYDPADATGLASKMLPFTTPSVAGVSGYVLQREPVRSLALADVKRRIALGNIADPNPVVSSSTDLAAWIASLSQWLTDYNNVHGTSWTAANVLCKDTTAQRAFIEHFYGGLLDDELRTLADLACVPNVPCNSIGYARVNPQPYPPGTSISDSVDGTGYGRTLYRLAAVNPAGSVSATSGSIGPYYTQIVTPPRSPVLYKVQATESAIIVAWALDTNPDVAAYMVYRGPSAAALADLRYFGANPAKPVAASQLPSVQYNEQSWPPLSFVQSASPNIDQRIVGFVPDPRLCARDYAGSTMGEIVLPPGPPPDVVNGVFRLSDYDTKNSPLGQLAFNYWTPPIAGGGGGIAKLQTDSPNQSRLIGLRIGLGRGVPVVVVATWKNTAKVIGYVTVRRTGFIDGLTPSDPNAIPNNPMPGATLASTYVPPSATAPNFYVVVAVDIFGNRSAPQKIAFATQMLAKAS